MNKNMLSFILFLLDNFCGQ